MENKVKVKNLQKSTVAIKKNRRYDIDWLRVIAILSVIALHSAVIFSFGIFPVKHFQHSIIIDTIDVFFSVWTIPLLFLLSGAASKFALEKSLPKKLVIERIKRLLVPLLTFLVIPAIAAHIFKLNFLFQLPGNPKTAFTVVGTGHLWFIGYLLFFSLVTLPFFVFLRKPAGKKIISSFANVCSKPGVLFLLAIPVLGISPMDNDNTFLRFYYVFYFIYGFFIVSNYRFEQAIYQQTWLALIAGVGLVILMIYQIETNFHISSFERFVGGFSRWFLVVAFLGLGQRYLNKTNKALQYLNEASYPIYILHFIITIVVGYYIAVLSLPVVSKYTLIVSIASIITLFVYDIFVKRIFILRLLFGMKPKNSSN